MVENFDIEDVFKCGLNLLDPGITKLEYFRTIGKDDVVVLLILMCLFKLGEVLSKLMFPNKVARQQQLCGVV